MAGSDAGQRLEAVPTAGTGCDFAVSNRPAVSTPATATRRCRSQSLTTSGMIYDHVSIKHFIQSKRQAKLRSLMAALRDIHIDAPPDFAANLDLYVSGEKRVEPDPH